MPSIFVSQGCHHKGTTNWEPSNKRKVLSHSCGGFKSKTKVSAGPLPPATSGENPLLSLPASSHPHSFLFLNNSVLSLVPFAFYIKQQRGAWLLLPHFAWKFFHLICIQVHRFYVPLSCQQKNVIQSSALPLFNKDLLPSNV